MTSRRDLTRHRTRYPYGKQSRITVYFKYHGTGRRILSRSPLAWWAMYPLGEALRCPVKPSLRRPDRRK